MSVPGPEEVVDALGQQQDSEVDPAGADPREPDTEVTEDQSQEIDPGATDPR